jgi:methyl-accepting chemotaxis protein/methyl-accepting chemotaxis protein-1 (serine sensor receptor)
MTIGRKLALNFAGMFALLLASSLVARNLVQSLGGALDVAVDSTACKMQVAGSIRAGFQEMNATTRATHVNYVIRELERGRRDASCGGCHDAGKIEQSCAALEATAAELRNQFRVLRPLATGWGERQALEALEMAEKSWSSEYQEYLRLAGAGRFEAAHAVVTDRMYPILEEVKKSAGALRDQEWELLRTSSESVRRTVRRNQLVSRLLIGMSLVISVGVFLTLRHIQRVLGGLSHELREGAEQVAGASGHISAASQSLAQGASEQAISLEQTASFGEQIKSSSRKNAADSRGAADSVSRVGEGVAKSNEALRHLLSAMQEIDSSSHEISRIIRVIEEIAFQTNILALNAAVEAARAGEAGMGFAVVANEVRSLAQRSSEAARETTGLIERSISKAGSGKMQVNRVVEAVRLVTESASEAQSLMQGVYRSNDEQARETEQIAAAIAEMERVTRAAAASAEESASAGEQLSTQAQNLRGIVARIAALTGAGPA